MMLELWLEIHLNVVTFSKVVSSFLSDFKTWYDDAFNFLK